MTQSQEDWQRQYNHLRIVLNRIVGALMDNDLEKARLIASAEPAGEAPEDDDPPKLICDRCKALCRERFKEPPKNDGIWCCRECSTWAEKERR